MPCIDENVTGLESRQQMPLPARAKGYQGPDICKSASAHSPCEIPAEIFCSISASLILIKLLPGRLTTLHSPLEISIAFFHFLGNIMNTACTKIVRECNRLAALSDDQFAQQFLPFTEMVECLFLFEECQMENIDFPFLKSHREQHAMVLRSLCRVVPQVLAGETGMAREVLHYLPSWMMLHSSTSDRFAQEHIDRAGNSAANAAVLHRNAPPLASPV